MATLSNINLEYDIIYAGNLDDLLHRVRTMIKEGWSPLGGPFVKDDNYHQAMVRDTDAMEYIPGEFVMDWTQ